MYMRYRIGLRSLLTAHQSFGCGTKPSVFGSCGCGALRIQDDYGSRSANTKDSTPACAKDGWFGSATKQTGHIYISNTFI